MKTVEFEQIKQSFEVFIQEKKSCVLSLVDSQGKPYSSLTPFVRVEGKFYIYISRIAEHFPLIEKAQFVDVLCVADEAKTPNKFATERARWQCTPKHVGNEGQEEVFAAFDLLHGGKMMQLLRSLDFSLFELTPLLGRYIMGFGKAYEIDVDNDTLRHVVIDKK